MGEEDSQEASGTSGRTLKVIEPQISGGCGSTNMAFGGYYMCIYICICI